MKTLKEYKVLSEAIEQVNKALKKAVDNKNNLKISDEILISNLAHDLDSLMNYKKSDGRK